MENILMVRIESVYGNKLIYPVNSTALSLAKLIGKKTISKEQIVDIQKLGFKVEVEREELWLLMKKKDMTQMRKN
mgnify:CR=1 FL=1